MRRGRRLTPSPTTNTQYSIVNPLPYVIYYISHIHIELSVLTEYERYTETKDHSLVREVLRNLHSCNVLTLNNLLLTRNCVISELSSYAYKTLAFV
jgi:hypothetical protein